MRYRGILSVAVFLCVGLLAAHAAAAGKPAPLTAGDRACYFTQGFCDPKGEMGQSEHSKDQIHGVSVSGWGSVSAPAAVDKSGSASAIYKMVQVDEQEVLPVLDMLWHMANDPHAPTAPQPNCQEYYAFLKSTQGVPHELWCWDGAQLRLIWEMLSATQGRFWERYEKDGALTSGILLFDSRVKSGAFFPNLVREHHFSCGNGKTVPVEGPFYDNVMDFNRSFGPLDTSSPKAWRQSIKSLRAAQIVDPGVPDELALPHAWYKSLQSLQRADAEGSSGVMVLEGHWGDVVCADPNRAETCRSSVREFFFFPRIGKASGGPSRWMAQEWDGSQWVTQADGGVGSVSAYAAEDPAVGWRPPCGSQVAP